ncbi:MAG: DUF2971 domain-containing protein [Polyangia bacterium]
METDSEILYHYTDAKGALGILGSQELWATALSHMTDQSELMVFIDPVEAIIRNKYSERKNNLKTKIDAMKNMLLELSSTLFAFCLSKKEDLLSQWRGYCPVEGGVAIGFDSGCLRKNSIAQKHVLLKCEYCNPKKIVENPYSLREIEKQLKNDTNRVLERMGISEIDNLQNRTGIDAELFVYVLYLLEFSLKYKNIGFKEEEEWRILYPVFPSQKKTHGNIFFRTRRGCIIPYTKLPIDKSCVKKIIVGPGKNKEQIADTLRYSTLPSYGYSNKDVEVYCSDIPYNP